MMEIMEIEKLAHSQVGMAAAYRAGLPLQERGWMLYPAPCWDKPAILAFEGGRCVAGLNFTEDADDLVLRIDFAWCDAGHPTALVWMLGRFRARYAGGRFREIRFTCHEGNEAMKKCVSVMGLTPTSHSYQMPIAAMSRRQQSG